MTDDPNSPAGFRGRRQFPSLQTSTRFRIGFNGLAASENCPQYHLAGFAFDWIQSLNFLVMKTMW
jgi:hypothetical protein